MKNKHSFRRMRNQTVLYLKRNSSTILTCIGAVGVVATAISTGLATPKALQRVSKAEKEKRRKLSKVEKFIVAAPPYLPPAAIGASTIICIFGANALDKKHQAALTSAYALANSSFKEYRDKLIELHGKEIDDEVRDALVRTNCQYHQIGIDIPDDKLVWVESITGETIVAYEKEIMDAEYHFNRNFVLRGYASLNEFFEFLGLPRTEYGDSVGWTSADGYYWIDFEHRLEKEAGENGEDIYEIGYIYHPDADYLREWE